MIKIWLILFFSLVLLSSSCLAEILVKQQDEYSCAPVSSYNLITKLCPDCKKDIKSLHKLEKTNFKGTTTYNLCQGLKKYFKKQSRKVQIKYYGIKKIRKYKISSNINIEELTSEISNNSQSILNIGIYIKNSNGNYVRQWGHYVNLISIEENNQLIVFDPYDKNKTPINWKLKQLNGVCLKNINDNEKYEKTTNIYAVENKIHYLEPNEIAIINGIVVVKLD